jgi:thiaminase/transcriptional activator TenA
VLPCYWIYWEVGRELQKKGSEDTDYQRWIDQYASEEFGHSVEQVLTMMNAEAEGLGTESREVLKDLFEKSSSPCLKTTLR